MLFIDFYSAENSTIFKFLDSLRKLLTHSSCLVSTNQHLQSKEMNSFAKDDQSSFYTSRKSIKSKPEILISTY